MNLMTTVNTALHAKHVKKFPAMKVGSTIKVHQRIVEGKKERIQVFEGMIIKRHGKKPENTTITVRRIASGIGVERIFPLISSKIEKIQTTKDAKVRRAKLYYLRGLRGKSARLKETYLGEESAAPTEEMPAVEESQSA